MTSVTAPTATQAAASASPTRTGTTVASVEADRGFAAAMNEVGATTSAAPDTSVAFRHQTSRSGELKPEQAFESFVLRSFIEEMLPKENTAVFGSGTAGNIWRSMLAERIADEMAAGGGIGIAKTISRDAPAKPD
jgi:peptidoglycan hydrolase FlgJ